MRLLVCDGCGAHARRMLACVQCRLARYCDTECQRLAWRAYHRVMCAAMIGAPSEEFSWAPGPYMSATLKLGFKIPYVRYLHLIECFATPDSLSPRKRIDAGEYPPAAVLAAATFAPGCDAAELKIVAAVFKAMTGSALNAKSVVRWRYVCAARAIEAWERDPADNTRSPLTSIMHRVTPGRVPGGATLYVDITAGVGECIDNVIVRVELDACGCCLRDVVLAPILNRRMCLVHHVASTDGIAVIVPAHEDVERIEYLGRDGALADIFVATEFLDFAAAVAPCACMQSTATPARIAGPDGVSVLLGCVRLTLSSGDLLEVLAFGSNDKECFGDWCTLPFRVRGPYLALDATL